MCSDDTGINVGIDFFIKKYFNAANRRTLIEENLNLNDLVISNKK